MNKKKLKDLTKALAKSFKTRERPLDDLYPTLYLDGIVVKVHQDKRVINKTVYLALGINSEGQKTLLGLWLSENEGAKFWLSVLTELKKRSQRHFHRLRGWINRVS